MKLNISLLHVAVGLVYDAQGKILVTQRPKDVDHGGYWVFPGGKVEPGETVYQALVRELQEEVGICVLSATPYMVIQHQYPDKKVLLDVWEITECSGEPYACENQPAVRWVTVAELQQLPFPAGNDAIIERLLQPRKET